MSANVSVKAFPRTFSFVEGDPLSCNVTLPNGEEVLVKTNSRITIDKLKRRVFIISKSLAHETNSNYFLAYKEQEFRVEFRTLESCYPAAVWQEHVPQQLPIQLALVANGGKFRRKFRLAGAGRSVSDTTHAAAPRTAQGGRVEGVTKAEKEKQQQLGVEVEVGGGSTATVTMAPVQRRVPAPSVKSPSAPTLSLSKDLLASPSPNSSPNSSPSPRSRAKSPRRSPKKQRKGSDHIGNDSLISLSPKTKSHKKGKRRRKISRGDRAFTDVAPLVTVESDDSSDEAEWPAERGDKSKEREKDKSKDKELGKDKEKDKERGGRPKEEKRSRSRDSVSASASVSVSASGSGSGSGSGRTTLNTRAISDDGSETDESGEHDAELEILRTNFSHISRGFSRRTIKPSGDPVERSDLAKRFAFSEQGRRNSLSKLKRPSQLSILTSLPISLGYLRPLMRPSPQYWIEAGDPGLAVDALKDDLPFEMAEIENDFAWYAEHFANFKHHNYIGMDKTFGPFITSVTREDSSSTVSVIIRTRKETVRRSIQEKSKGLNLRKRPLPSIESVMKATLPHFSRNVARRVRNDMIIPQLIQFDAEHFHKQLKFGILHCREAQVSEDEMFGNEHPSAQFQEFLEFIGTPVRLKNWKGYSAGLDTERDTTGKESVYTLFRGYEVMFHVSTLLPFSLTDSQQLARKRHLGNDVVLVVFKEGNTPYLPHTVASMFNHVIVVVQPIHFDGQQRYRISVASRESVPRFGPEVPDPALFHKDDVFREFFLTKLINGERAGMKAERFAKAIHRTRSDRLKEIFQLCS